MQEGADEAPSCISVHVNLNFSSPETKIDFYSFALE